MNYKNAFRFFISAAAIACAMSLVALTVNAQDKSESKSKPASEKSAKPSGRDPFKKYQPVVKAPKPPAAKLEPPSIQVRIERYRAQKAAAASAHVAAPKPTTALMLSEVQVTGIFRTPRGWSAMVEATPLSPKLSYVVYPGESFFDGQLVAIEESRLVFRRDIVWTDGKREKSIEIKPLRTPSAVEAMTASKPAQADAAANQAKTEAAKPESPKPAPEKQ
jgi:Tfp pilus assembly protein PilP